MKKIKSWLLVAVAAIIVLIPSYAFCALHSITSGGEPVVYDDITGYFWQDLAHHSSGLTFEAAIAGIEIEVLATPLPVEDDPVARGRVVYDERGCGACHIITGVSEGIVGPNLNNIGEVAATRQEGVSASDYIRQSILAPNAYIVEGYSENLMPQNFRDLISDPELNDLIEFLLAQK